MPAVWSTILSLPFFGTGFYFNVAETTYPAELGIPFLFFALFIVVVGLYVHFVASPEPPTMSQGEELVDTRHPTQRVALAKVAISVPFLFVALYLLFFTLVPYVYPTVTFLLGLYFFSSGLRIYWKNSLTTYYLTTRRVIKEYRLLSLSRRELPLGKVRGVEERKSPIEALVGLGNVRIASGGGGGTLEVVLQNMERSTEFANEVRELLTGS